MNKSPSAQSKRSQKRKVTKKRNDVSPVPHYSNSLAKTTNQLNVYNSEIERLQDEKGTLAELIK